MLFQDTVQGAEYAQLSALRESYLDRIREAQERISSVWAELEKAKLAPEPSPARLSAEDYFRRKERFHKYGQLVSLGLEADLYRSALPHIDNYLELYSILDRSGSYRRMQGDSAQEKSTDSQDPVENLWKKYWKESEQKRESEPSLHEKRYRIAEKRQGKEDAAPDTSISQISQAPRYSSKHLQELVELKNRRPCAGIESIVSDTGWLSSADEAREAFKQAMSDGHKIKRYDNRLAPVDMKKDMLRQYSTEYGKSLRQIALELSERYGMNVSESTIRKYAKKRLGDVSRRKQQAKGVFQRLIRKLRLKRGKAG